jgi:hypothetical protein
MAVFSSFSLASSLSISSSGVIDDDMADFSAQQMHQMAQVLIMATIVD